MAKKSQPVAAEQTNQSPDEAEQLREELATLRGTLSSTESALREERTARQQAQLAQMSEAERRIAAEQDSCESLLTSLSGQADGLEAQIASLSDEPGHGAEIAKLTRQLSQVTAKVYGEEQRKAWLAEQREQAKTRTAPQPTTDRKLANGIPTANFSPATRAWLDKHPKAYEDAAYCKRLVAYAAVAKDIEGLDDNSPDFFAFIEEKMGERQAPPAPRVAAPEDGEEIPTAESPYSQTTPTPASAEVDYEPVRPQPRAAGPGSISTVAVPSRTIPGSTPTGSGRAPVLSAQERETADNLYASDPKCKTAADRYAKYARNKTFMGSYQQSHFGAN